VPAIAIVLALSATLVLGCAGNKEPRPAATRTHDSSDVPDTTEPAPINEATPGQAKPNVAYTRRMAVLCDRLARVDARYQYPRAASGGSLRRWSKGVAAGYRPVARAVAAVKAPPDYEAVHAAFASALVNLTENFGDLSKAIDARDDWSVANDLQAMRRFEDTVTGPAELAGLGDCVRPRGLKVDREYPAHGTPAPRAVREICEQTALRERETVRRLRALRRAGSLTQGQFDFGMRNLTASLDARFERLVGRVGGVGSRSRASC
jgi:hypothetical protein